MTIEVQHLLGKGIFRGVALQGTDGLRRANDNDRADLLLRFLGDILLIDALQGTCPLVIGSVVASCELVRVVLSGALGFPRVGSAAGVDGCTSVVVRLDSLVALGVGMTVASWCCSRTSPRIIPAYPWLLASDNVRETHCRIPRLA